MNSKNNPHATFLHLFRRHHSSTSDRSLDPLREWWIGIGVAFCLFAAGAAYSFYLFEEGKRTIDTPPAPEESVVHYDAATVADVLALYRERRIRFEALQESSLRTPVIFDLPESAADDEGAASGAIRLE